MSQSTFTHPADRSGESVVVPRGEPVALVDCPIGLFMDAGELCLKTEYGNNEGRIDAYIVSSGEFYWGAPPQSIASQRASIVQPMDLVAAAPSPPPQQEGGEAKPYAWAFEARSIYAVDQSIWTPRLEYVQPVDGRVGAMEYRGIRPLYLSDPTLELRGALAPFAAEAGRWIEMGDTTGWRPIESAPKDGTDILVYVAKTREQMVVYWLHGKFAFAHDKQGYPIFVTEPTCWQPLPTPFTSEPEGSRG